MKIPGWSARVWRDLTTRKFVPLKILYFLVSAATSAMMPFLTLHARSLGILEMELGIIFAVNAVFTIIVPTPAGILADKIGNFKVFLSLMMAASGGAALVFSAVPVARRYHTLPDSLPLTLSLVGDGPPTLSVPSLQCDYLPLLNNLTITIANCSLCDPSSVSEGGCVPPAPSLCPGQQVKAAGETQMQVSVATSNDSIWNATYLEVISWSDAEFLPQAGAEDQWCPIQCPVMVLRPDLCTNTHTLETFDTAKTFWLYLLVRILNGITLAGSFSLFDGATMAITMQYGGEYGLQRLYSNLGSIVMTPISGVLIDYFSDRGGLQDYRPSFYLYCGLKVLAAVIILFLDLDFRQPSSRVLKDFRTLLKKPEILSFLIVMLIAGTCFGVLDTFLFWLLQDLGAQKYLMGITVTVGFSAGVPVLVASGYIFKRLGFPNTIVLGFAVYVFRMLGYSFITNPWWCMPFEAMECFTVSLMSAAAVSYAADLATPATLATLQGLYGGIYHGVGRGLGSLVSGFLMAPLGLRNVFRVLALVCGATGVLYFATNCLFFRKLQKKRKVRFEQLREPDSSDRPAEEKAGTDTCRQKGSVTQEGGEADTMLCRGSESRKERKAGRRGEESEAGTGKKGALYRLYSTRSPPRCRVGGRGGSVMPPVNTLKGSAALQEQKLCGSFPPSHFRSAPSLTPAGYQAVAASTAAGGTLNGGQGAGRGGEGGRGRGQAGAEGWSGAMTPGTAHRLKLGQAAVAVAVAQASSSPQSAPWSYLRRPDTRSDTVS